MARKVSRRSSPASPPDAIYKDIPGSTRLHVTATGVAFLILIVLISAALGSGITYFVLKPQLTRSAVAQHLTADASLSLANSAFDSRNWADAVKNYAQAIAAGNDTPDIRTDYGTALRGLHQPQKAIEQYQAAQKADPHHENSLLNQGIVYATDLHDPAQAQSVWQTYLTRFPNGAHVADVKRLLASLPPAISKPSVISPKS